jgi:hypothetical protein
VKVSTFQVSQTVFGITFSKHGTPTAQEAEDKALALSCRSSQRTNTKNWKQIFPEKELRSQSPNFHIHVSVSDLYIPMIDLPIMLQEICGPILGIYKSLRDT